MSPNETLFLDSTPKIVKEGIDIGICINTGIGVLMYSYFSDNILLTAALPVVYTSHYPL